MKRIILIVISFAFVLGSVLYTNHLAEELSLEEQKKIQTWAEATKRLVPAEDEGEIEFLLQIIEGNTTIPVYMADSLGTYLFSRNDSLPKKLEMASPEEQTAYYQRKVDELRAETTPIEMRIPINIDGTEGEIVQYIYYGESTTLRMLKLLPYMQFILILMFLVVAIVTITTSYKSEENRVWVGLSKETAHQLGTPISSLNAWNELLRLQYPENTAFDEIDRDIQRLTTITERFSKIGSLPTLEPTDIRMVTQDAMRYMETRTSDKIEYAYIDQTHDADVAEEKRGALNVQLNTPLFTWVIENLIRNSVDAMNGAGKITIRLSEDSKHVILDVSDTGKGIERRRWRRVFQPGHTTKQRGWGLGLSLAKRIIREYHHGSIYVLASEIGKGTTFRIELKKA